MQEDRYFESQRRTRQRKRGLFCAVSKKSETADSLIVWASLRFDHANIVFTNTLMKQNRQELLLQPLHIITQQIVMVDLLLLVTCSAYLSAVYFTDWVYNWVECV